MLQVLCLQMVPLPYRLGTRAHNRWKENNKVSVKQLTRWRCPLSIRGWFSSSSPSGLVERTPPLPTAERPSQGCGCEKKAQTGIRQRGEQTQTLLKWANPLVSTIYLSLGIRCRGYRLAAMCLKLSLALYLYMGKLSKYYKITVSLQFSLF